MLPMIPRGRNALQLNSICEETAVSKAVAGEIIDPHLVTLASSAGFVPLGCSIIANTTPRYLASC